MPQSLSQVIVHIIFSTADRRQYLDDEIRGRLHAYIGTVLGDVNSYAFRIGGTHDHVHIACTLPRRFSQSDLVSQIKTTSSKWLKGIDSPYGDFAWQNGYGVFSVSQSHIEKLVEYIDRQREHHKKTTFKEEFRQFLHKYGIEYDERYVWD